MIKKEAHLLDAIFDEELEQVPTRNGFGDGLVEVGERDERVVVLCADLADSTRVAAFRDKFPDRYVELGVAEQNLATVGSGFAHYGKIPYITSYAAFSPGRNNEQIRTTISLNNVPVKIAGAHAGVSVGPDGATHQALEDIALMRVQPNMTVVAPCDAQEARKAVHAAYEHDGPMYLRFARAKTPLFTSHETPFEFGKANVFFDNESIEAVLFTCGPLTHKALTAAHELEQEGVKVAVVNIHTIKPIDREAIVDYARRAGAVVSVEEHQIAGGLGSAVSEVLSQEYPVPQEFIGVRDSFGQSGDPEELIEHYGMGAGSIKEAVKRVIDRK